VTWPDVLARIEADVCQAEALIAADGGRAADPAGTGALEPASSGWAPPAGLGPLPTDLVERATRLLARQAAVSAALAELAATSRQHLAYTSAILAPKPPAYLDLAG
jgi:hypothetical protein